MSPYAGLVHFAIMPSPLMKGLESCLIGHWPFAQSIYG